MFRKTAVEKLGDLAGALMARGPLHAPVRGAKSVDYEKIQAPAEVTLDFIYTAMSPKGVFLPQSEELIRYKLGKVTEEEIVPINAEASVLFGVRPWDAKSFQIMDRHFLGAGIVDPYWKERRDKTTVVGYGLDPTLAPDPADFFSTLGIHGSDTEGSDVFMIRKDGTLLFKGVTEKGDRLLEGLAALEAATAEDEALFEAEIARGREVRTRFLPIEEKAMADKLVRIFENKAFWEEKTLACIGCGACTFVCPTCYCFDISDETLFRQGARKRFWDACMFTDFTLEASGHNPRSKIFQRYRQKVCHKYSYHVTKYGCISCVGCGRCTRACPVNMDIFSIVEAAAQL